MLRLFGPPTISDASALQARMAFAMAAMIDTETSRTLSRAEIAASLWPTRVPHDASNNLRQILSDARRWEDTNHRRLFQSTVTAITRNSTTEPSDLSIFLQTGTVATEDALLRLNELYRGDLLEGMDALEGDASLWLMSQRDRMQSRFVTLALAGALQAPGHAALDVLERLSHLSPYDEQVARGKMVVGLHVGGQRVVEQAFEQFADRLNADLGARPQPATVELRRELTATTTVSVGDQPARSRTGLSSVPRVLILPPQPLPNRLYSENDVLLASSLVDEVTHSLSRARTFAVFAPHTARQVAAQPFAAGNPYGVDYLVSTALLPAASGETRLTFRLTDVASHEVQLSDELTFHPDQLGPGHYVMAAGLASGLAASIERSELSHYRTTGSASAYVQYLLGTDALRVADLPKVRRARKHFQQAIKLSPHFARARSMLARTLSMEFLLLGRKEMEPLELALEHAREALRDAPADPMIHREVGHALIYFDELDEAVENLRHAADLGPHFADVLCTFADSLIHIGRHPEARPILDKALALNPLAPDWYHWTSATSHFLLGDYRATTASINRMKAPASAGRISAAAEALSGNLEAAHRHRDQFMALNPDFRVDDYLFPIRDLTDRDRLICGLRQAGFP